MMTRSHFNIIPTCEKYIMYHAVKKSGLGGRMWQIRQITDWALAVTAFKFLLLTWWSKQCL